MKTLALPLAVGIKVFYEEKGLSLSIVYSTDIRNNNNNSPFY